MLEYIGVKRPGVKVGSSPERWHPPSEDTLKFNFDGDSKGNPGIAGGGGLIISPK